MNRIGLPFQNLAKSLVALIMAVLAYCPFESSPACLECARVSTKCPPHWHISFLLLRILNLRVRLNGFYIQVQVTVHLVDGRSVRLSVKSLMGRITKFYPRSRERSDCCTSLVYVTCNFFLPLPPATTNNNFTLHAVYSAHGKYLYLIFVDVLIVYDLYSRSRLCLVAFTKTTLTPSVLSLLQYCRVGRKWQFVSCLRVSPSRENLNTCSEVAKDKTHLLLRPGRRL